MKSIWIGLAIVWMASVSFEAEARALLCNTHCSAVFLTATGCKVVKDRALASDSQPLIAAVCYRDCNGLGPGDSEIPVELEGFKIHAYPQGGQPGEALSGSFGEKKGACTDEQLVALKLTSPTYIASIKVAQYSETLKTARYLLRMVPSANGGGGGVGFPYEHPQPREICFRLSAQSGAPAPACTAPKPPTPPTPPANNDAPSKPQPPTAGQPPQSAVGMGCSIATRDSKPSAFWGLLLLGLLFVGRRKSQL